MSENRLTQNSIDPRQRTCRQCNKVFFVKPSELGRYCSRSCAWMGTKGPEYNALISQNSAKKRGDMLRGLGRKGYIKLNGRHEHRVVAEKMIGRPLRKGEIVHHKDGDKQNNDPSNLSVMMQRDHMQEHGLGIPGKPLIHKPWKFRRTT